MNLDYTHCTAAERRASQGLLAATSEDRVVSSVFADGRGNNFGYAAKSKLSMSPLRGGEVADLQV